MLLQGIARRYDSGVYVASELYVCMCPSRSTNQVPVNYETATFVTTVLQLQPYVLYTVHVKV